MATDTDYERLQGQITAHNLLLRGLYTAWAVKSADPN
jgi:hypothetical protein